MNGSAIGKSGLFSAACMLLVTLMTGTASAQLQYLDKSTLIDGLAREGMDELLAHLIEVEPPEDSITKQQLEIARYRIRFDRLARQSVELEGEAAQRALAEAGEAFEGLLAANRKLIAENMDDPRRPIWQTDLADLLLFEYLQVVHQQADIFYEFGLPSPQQRKAFEDASAEARDLTDASLKLFKLQSDLPKRKDFKERFELPGLFRRLTDDYMKIRTPFFQAHASYYTALISKDHAYYKTLGANPLMPPGYQKSSVGEERKRLLTDASNQLLEILKDKSDRAGVRTQALLIAGRARGRLKDTGEALKLLQEVERKNPPGFMGIIVQLGIAAAYSEKGDIEPAMNTLDRLSSNGTVKGNLLYRLLVTDMKHRVLLAAARRAPADRKAAMFEQAYAPYMELINSPDLGERAEGFKNYIFERWRKNVPDDARCADLPSVVLLAFAAEHLVRGQNLAVESQQLVESDPDRAGVLQAQAKTYLEPTVEICKEVLSRKNIDPSVAAEVQFKLALATYYLASSAENPNLMLLEAAKAFTDLADKYPTSGNATQAISHGVYLHRKLYESDKSPEFAEPYYHAMEDVLLKKYPNSEAAANERMYFAYLVLMEKRKDWKTAAELLKDVPANNPDFWLARRLMVQCLLEHYRTQEGAARQAAADVAKKAAQDLIAQAKQDVAGKADDVVADIQTAQGYASLYLVDLLLAQGNPLKAIDELEGFEQLAQGNDELLREGMERRIRANVAAGKFKEAADAAGNMMNRFPDDAAFIIDNMLTRIETRIGELRLAARESAIVQRKKDELNAQATGMGKSAVALAKLLVDWAQSQGKPEDEMASFHIVLARAHRMAEQYDEARAILEPLHEQFPDDGVIMKSLGDVYFFMGGETNLVKASRIFDKMIEGLGRDPTTNQYPSEWWHAWVRRLQINDKLRKFVGDISRTVKQLRITDTELGGEPYKSILEQLEAKHEANAR